MSRDAARELKSRELREYGESAPVAEYARAVANSERSVTKCEHAETVQQHLLLRVHLLIWHARRATYTHKRTRKTPAALRAAQSR